MLRGLKTYKFSELSWDRNLICHDIWWSKSSLIWIKKIINNFNQSVYISWLKKIYHFFSSHINIALNYYYFFPSSWQLVLYHCLLLILFEMWEQICAKNDTPKQLGLHHVGWTNGASAMCNDTPNSIKFCPFNDS